MIVSPAIIDEGKILDLASARPLHNLAEQVFMFVRRSTPIWRRRFDLRAELGRGMPAPARVIEHCPC
jgi:hypothetical protein